MSGQSDADAGEYSMPYLPFFFSMCSSVLLMIMINYFAQMLSFGRIQPFCGVLSVFLRTWRCRSAISNNQTCGNAIPLRPKALNHWIWLNFLSGHIIWLSANGLFNPLFGTRYVQPKLQHCQFNSMSNQVIWSGNCHILYNTTSTQITIAHLHEHKNAAFKSTKYNHSCRIRSLAENV